MINRYTSDCYLKSGPDMFKTLVVAHGTIFGERYSYAELLDEDETPPPAVPPFFVKTARLAFIRRYLVIRSER